MLFILKLHPEITIKSRDVRKRYTRLLELNVRKVFKHRKISVDICSQWDKLVLRLNPIERSRMDEIAAAFQAIPGLHQAEQVVESQFDNLDELVTQITEHFADRVKGQSFAVRVKRKGSHAFSSTELARATGGALLKNADGATVDLRRPAVLVNVEVDGQTLRMQEQVFPGMGGMPLPSQEDVLCLISGGYDSAVAAYHMIRRGARTHFIFFNLGGREHELAVRQLCAQLWQTYSVSHKVKFMAVDFAPMMNAIAEHVHSGVSGVVLKRMMLRVAEAFAKQLNIKALVTGECLGQVSSQTLSNLHTIDQVTDRMVLRPLIATDKESIIEQARHIGTEDIAKSIPEYCGVLSRNPSVDVSTEQAELAEQPLDEALIAQMVRATDVEDIRKIDDALEAQLHEAECIISPASQQVILDIRAPEEVELKPLNAAPSDVQTLPFFRLENQFPTLDPKTTYLLYCERGVMSRLQALFLQERGFTNVGVYRADNA